MKHHQTTYRSSYLLRLLGLFALSTLLSACSSGGTDGNNSGNAGTTSHTVTATAQGDGTISPLSRTVTQGSITSFTVSPDSGYSIDSASGCGGSLTGNTYTTGAVTANCTVTASFVADDDPVSSFTVTPSTGANGSISPNTAQIVEQDETTSFTLSPNNGYSIDSVTGCGGSLTDTTYTTGTITADCTVTASFEPQAPGTPSAPELSLTPTAIKTFTFGWNDVSGETEYRLLENPDGASGYTQVETIAADATSHEREVFLPGRINASYILQACNSNGCSDSSAVFVSGTLAAAVGYVKASNSGPVDAFGNSVALSADGSTLAVGAYRESSNATGINGDESNNDAFFSGAVYVFTRKDGSWVQQAYVKASNVDPNTLDAQDQFGTSIALSANGDTLAVGAPNEDSNAIGINGNESNNQAANSGAVYIFTRNDATWSQQAYVKASNMGQLDQFGSSVALAADGNTLAVGAIDEDSNATGINGDETNNASIGSGAVYIFTRSDTVWSQQAYVKASNTGASDLFGYSVALAADGNTLAVGAHWEASNATGINGDESDNSAGLSGAVYVFTRSGATWSQQAYIKASNNGAGYHFGTSVALAADGNTLVAGAHWEVSNATGINGDENDSSASSSGAVYVFTRSGTTWTQQAYVKASNTETNNFFGYSVALTAEGNTLAVGAYGEESSATGIGGDQSSDDASNSGAVYMFTRNGADWSQQAYVKASNTDLNDEFGRSVALAADGSTLAVGAIGERSNANAINGDQNDNSADSSGAVYLY